jgi:hypothetical protein
MSIDVVHGGGRGAIRQGTPKALIASPRAAHSHAALAPARSRPNCATDRALAPQTDGDTNRASIFKTLLDKEKRRAADAAKREEQRQAC